MAQAQDPPAITDSLRRTLRAQAPWDATDAAIGKTTDCSGT